MATCTRLLEGKCWIQHKKKKEKKKKRIARPSAAVDDILFCHCSIKFAVVFELSVCVSSQVEFERQNELENCLA